MLYIDQDMPKQVMDTANGAFGFFFSRKASACSMPRANLPTVCFCQGEYFFSSYRKYAFTAPLTSNGVKQEY